MKEFVIQETEEMTTFGSVWKRYEPVAELVRCKDCKYRYEHDHGESECEKMPGWFPVTDNWFCADGERK